MKEILAACILLAKVPTPVPNVRLEHDGSSTFSAPAPRFDIEQAHLSFARQPQSSDHSMPSLRRLVRATDWETVRAKLKAVEVGAVEEMRLRLVDDAKRGMIANQVQVSTFKPPKHSGESIKLCLQFSDAGLIWDLVFDENKSHRERNLTAINE
eukprot:s2391_g9.t1